MTSQRDFKHRIRERIKHTGESYTEARTALEAVEPAHVPDLSSLSAADRRYVRKVAKSYFRGERLMSVPSKRKLRVVVLLLLLARFQASRIYVEAEVNALLATADEDYAFLRRELVNYGYLKRENGQYWMAPTDPDHGRQVGQETLASEPAYLHHLRTRD